MQHSTHSSAEQLEVSPTGSTAEHLEGSLPHKAAYTKPVLTTYGSVKDLTMGLGGSGPDGSGEQDISDHRAKENIVRIGQHALGFGLYLFDYKPEFRKEWGSRRQFGVMAHEVEAVMPEAVTTHADGYKRVNYSLLGIHRTIH